MHRHHSRRHHHRPFLRHRVSLSAIARSAPCRSMAPRAAIASLFLDTMTSLLSLMLMMLMLLLLLLLFGRAAAEGGEGERTRKFFTMALDGARNFDLDELSCVRPVEALHSQHLHHALFIRQQCSTCSPS